MPKKYLLRGKKTFDKLFSRQFSSFKISNPYFYVVAQPASKLGFALITPKKVMKKATARNYSRRITKQMVQELLNMKHSLPQKHIAITTRVDLAQTQATYKELKEGLHTLLIKIPRETSKS